MSLGRTLPYGFLTWNAVLPEARVWPLGLVSEKALLNPGFEAVRVGFELSARRGCLHAQADGGGETGPKPGAEEDWTGAPRLRSLVVLWLWPVSGWSVLTRVALTSGREQDAKEGVDITFALVFGLVLHTGCPNSCSPLKKPKLHLQFLFACADLLYLVRGWQVLPEQDQS